MNNRDSFSKLKGFFMDLLSIVMDLGNTTY